MKASARKPAFLRFFGGEIVSVMEMSGTFSVHTMELPAPCPAHSHDFLEAACIRRGWTLHTVNGVTRRLEEGDVVLVDFGEVHSFDGGSADLLVTNCLFQPVLLDPSLASCRAPASRRRGFSRRSAATPPPITRSPRTPAGSPCGRRRSRGCSAGRRGRASPHTCGGSGSPSPAGCCSRRRTPFLSLPSAAATSTGKPSARRSAAPSGCRRARTGATVRPAPPALTGKRPPRSGF